MPTGTHVGTYVAVNCGKIEDFDCRAADGARSWFAGWSSGGSLSPRSSLFRLLPPNTYLHTPTLQELPRSEPQYVQPGHC